MKIKEGYEEVMNLLKKEFPVETNTKFDKCVQFFFTQAYINQLFSVRSRGDINPIICMRGGGQNLCDIEFSKISCLR